MNAPQSYADVDGLITLLQVACEDSSINATLEKLLSLPDARRRDFLKDLLITMREKKVQPELIEAMVCLVDDALAERAYEEIYRCGRKLV